MTKIKIINDPETKLCRCGSWLNHYKKFGANIVRLCVVKECTGHELTGVKVQKQDSEDVKIYIIPLCTTHAESKDELEIYDSIPLVSSDTKKTCGTSGMSYLKEGER
jgi:hypothetical protein